MKKNIVFSLVFGALVVGLLSRGSYKEGIGFRGPASVHGKISGLKKLFTAEVKKHPEGKIFLDNVVDEFNETKAAEVSQSDDWIDSFIASLPKNFRRHFTFIHRSYSIQKATPLAPRVILFGPQGNVMMTFNGGVDENGKKMQGGDNVEVIEWNYEKKVWDFSEIGFHNNKLEVKRNPARCVMCHSGTPKAVKFEHAAYYKDKLKPIFPQYPLWPGFYGGVNDIVGIAGTSDKVGVKWKETNDHIDQFTFGDHEELFRLRKLLDTNPKYREVVRNEINVYQSSFHEFTQSIKSKSRYKHLVMLSELYTDNNNKVPEFLKSEPYRRNFHKEYGHYLLRPNFYLSSLMTFYHAQNIAKEIIDFPEFDKFKYSLLAEKYNCDVARAVKVDGVGFKDLERTFDLVYPNIRNQETMDRQYLLAYQYNIVNAGLGGKPYLPLFAWNLEGNEDIASYHYGNVFSDLNELVLWDLARELNDDIFDKDDRPGAEKRHYDLPGSTYLEDYLAGAGGQRSGFSPSQQKFVTKKGGQPYYGYPSPRLKGLPVSSYCKKFIKKAKEELKVLAVLKTEGKLPHQIYALDDGLTNLPKWDANIPVALNGTRQACESCHVDREERIPPKINTDWMSTNYHKGLSQRLTLEGSEDSKQELIDYLNGVLSEEALPVPFGNSMPYGRRKMDNFSARCELLIAKNNYNFAEENPEADESLMFKSFQCDKEKDPDSINCRCRSLYIRKDNVFRKYYEPKKGPK